MNDDKLKAELRKILLTKSDPATAMAHRFEYHIFCSGEMHRIGRCAHEDIYPLIGEWVQSRFEKSDDADFFDDKPIHVFMDGRLWSVLRLMEVSFGAKAELEIHAAFNEVSFMFGIIEQPILENDPRVFKWRVGGAS